MTIQRIIAVDPGQDKCGAAVLDRRQGVLNHTVIAADQLRSLIDRWTCDYACRVIVVGDRTAHNQTLQNLQQLLAAKIIDQIVLIDEHKSTQEARQRYWTVHPPTGWRKIFPRGLLIPPCAIDDFAAIILAERYFAKNL